MELWEGGKHQWNGGLAKLGTDAVLITVELASMKMERVSGDRLKAGDTNTKQLHGNEQLEFWSMWGRLHGLHYSCWCRQRLCLEGSSCVWCLYKWTPKKAVSLEILSIRTSSCHLLAFKGSEFRILLQGLTLKCFHRKFSVHQSVWFCPNLAQDVTFLKQKEYFHLKYARAILDVFGTLNVLIPWSHINVKSESSWPERDLVKKLCLPVPHELFFSWWFPGS